MVLGEISDRGKTGLVFLDSDSRRGRGDPGRGLTAQRYVNEVLAPVVMPFICRNP